MAASARDDVLAILDRLGVPASAFARAACRPARPSPASSIGRGPRRRPRPRRPRRHRPGRTRPSWLAQRPGAAARRARPPARRGAARRQGRARPAGHPGGRQDRLRGPRRGAGDDRHLRLRGRPVAPALRPDHRLRAARPPDDGDTGTRWASCGVISAFNFPVAVWCWNAALALVCGDTVVWKPSEKTPLTALAVQALFERAAARFGDAPAGPLQRADRRPRGRRGAGRRSRACRWSPPPARPPWAAPSARALARALRPRRSWSSAATTPPSSARRPTSTSPLRAIAFAAMGTAGQRCTTLRRLIVHESIYDALVPRLKTVYALGQRRRPAAQPARWSAR